jgi:acyl carrier protein
MAAITEQIKAFLDQDLGIAVGELDNDTPLFSEGIIDSFALISLVVFIEETFGFRIGAFDVNLANFDSLSRMQRYIETSRGVG